MKATVKSRKKRSFALPEPLELIVFDFDGVFTDNKVYICEDGKETVVCDRRDSLGINMIKALGVPMFILSLEKNPVVSARARKMGIEARSGCADKRRHLEQYSEFNGTSLSNTIYIGNDLNDLEAMRIVGCPVCPSDAHPEIKKVSSYVLGSRGGAGAVRELAELIIRSAGY